MEPNFLFRGKYVKQALKVATSETCDSENVVLQLGPIKLL